MTEQGTVHGMPEQAPSDSSVGKSLVLLVAQLMVVPIVVAILATPCVLLVLAVLERITTAPLIEGTIAYGIVVVAGFLIGLGSYRTWVFLYPTGSHLWILPGAVYSMIVIFALISETPSEVANALFRISGHGGLGVLFFTFPTIAICSYSSGMLAMHRRRRKDRTKGTDRLSGLASHQRR